MWAHASLETTITASHHTNHSKDDQIISASVNLSLKSKGTCVLHYATWTNSQVLSQINHLDSPSVVIYFISHCYSLKSEYTTILGSSSYDIEPDALPALLAKYCNTTPLIRRRWKSVWYGPWNIYLTSLFPAADGFQVKLVDDDDNKSTILNFIIEVVQNPQSPGSSSPSCSYCASQELSALAKERSTAVVQICRQANSAFAQTAGGSYIGLRDRSTLAIWHQGGRRSTRAISTCSLAPHYSWRRFFRWLADARRTDRCTLGKLHWSMTLGNLLTTHKQKQRKGPS